MDEVFRVDKVFHADEVFHVDEVLKSQNNGNHVLLLGLL